jgi:hypothetical protein
MRKHVIFLLMMTRFHGQQVDDILPVDREVL